MSQYNFYAEQHFGDICRMFIKREKVDNGPAYRTVEVLVLQRIRVGFTPRKIKIVVSIWAWLRMLNHAIVPGSYDNSIVANYYRTNLPTTRRRQ